MAEAKHYNAIVVGGGFAGLYALHRLRKQGFSVRLYEAGDGIGGTWFWNRYPGARVDIQSLEYSYQFDEDLQQEWTWSEKYAPQSELLEYANHVADRFKLWPDIQLNTRVAAAHFEDDGRWHVTTGQGEKSDATFLIMATGCLSSVNVPKFEGLDSFKGRTFHTGRWPKEKVDFTGRRVGVVGTGSSAIQSIPLIAKEAAHLTVFQRTPNYSSPAHNGPIPEETVRDIKSRYADYRAANNATALGADWGYREDSALAATEEERNAEYESRWQKGGLSIYGSFADLLSDPVANNTAAEFFRSKIRSIVRDPKIAEMLCPTTHVGCKRVCVDTGYFDTYNRPNVSLVDLRAAPIEAVTPQGIRTVDGKVHELDDIVFATGFDAMTGPLTRMDIRGAGGVSIQQAWAEGPKNYLGLSVAGFPNMFIIAGPGSPSVLSNMLPSIEQHVNFIGDTLDYLRAKGLRRIEAEVPAQEAWVAHVNETAAPTILPTCNSWYLGANIPGKPRVFMPYLGFAPYVEKCKDVVAKGYEGFALG